MNNKKSEEERTLLEQIDIKKYRTKGYFPGFRNLVAQDPIISNYYLFADTAESLKIIEKSDDIIEKLDTFKNNVDENEMKLIKEEIKNIKKEYNAIMREAKENKYFYFKYVMDLYVDYDRYYWISGVGNIFNKVTTGILLLLNNNYVNYEKKLKDISFQLKELNLRLTNIFY